MPWWHGAYLAGWRRKFSLLAEFDLQDKPVTSLAPGDTKAEMIASVLSYDNVQFYCSMQMNKMVRTCYVSCNKGFFCSMLMDGNVQKMFT